MSVVLTLSSMLGGGLMFAVGAIYLLFDKRISQTNSTGEDVESSTHFKSRIVLGVQVGRRLEK
jgi:hypothetical protein